MVRRRQEEDAAGCHEFSAVRRHSSLPVELLREIGDRLGIDLR